MSADDRMAAMESLFGGVRRGESKVAKTAFSWPGSKLKSLDNLLQLVPYSKTYCELFGGSGVLLLNRSKSRFEIFNDRHSGVTDFWIALRDQKDELIERVGGDIYSKELFEYYRDNWEKQDTRIERAARWYYSITYSFNQLGRHWGRERTKSSVSKMDNRLLLLPELSDRLHSVVVENGSWEELFEYYDSPETTFYLDPPYIETPTGTYKHNMSLADHEAMLQKVIQAQGTVCLSGYKNDLILKYPWDEVHSWEVRDCMARAVERSDTDVEVLYIKRSSQWRGNTKQIMA